jgi:hypothetical protein
VLDQRHDGDAIIVKARLDDAAVARLTRAGATIEVVQ